VHQASAILLSVLQMAHFTAAVCHEGYRGYTLPPSQQSPSSGKILIRATYDRHFHGPDPNAHAHKCLQMSTPVSLGGICGRDRTVSTPVSVYRPNIAIIVSSRGKILTRCWLPLWTRAVLWRTLKRSKELSSVAVQTENGYSRTVTANTLRVAATE
jgi:hypothetical protein